MCHLGGIAVKRREDRKALMTLTAWELHSLLNCQLEPGTSGQLPHLCLISAPCVFNSLLVANTYHNDQEMKAQSRKEVRSCVFLECTPDQSLFELA